MTALLDPGVSRQEPAQHLDACAPCAALLAFAAIAVTSTPSPRVRQLAVHVEVDRERQDFERGVARRIATAATRGASLVEVLVALGVVAILTATALHYGLPIVERVCAVLGPS